MTQEPNTPANPYADSQPKIETPNLQSINVLHMVVSIWIVVYVLTYLSGLLLQLVIPDAATILIPLALLVLGVVGSILVFMLASKMGGVAIGIAYGVVSLIPCLGILSLFVIAGQAMAFLKENGIATGFGNTNAKLKS